MRTNRLIAAHAIVVAAALAGCSGASTEAEQKEALLLAVSPTTAPNAAFESFEAKGCTQKDAVYNCQLKGVLAYTFTFGDMSDEKRQSLAGNYVFMKTDNGWRLVR